MNRIKIALVSPSGTFSSDELSRATAHAKALGFDVVSDTTARSASPAFLNGSADERLTELENAEHVSADAIWCVRGGCGAVELWPTYNEASFSRGRAPLIGYSDSTIYHFMRFLRAGRIGIHGSVFLDLANGDTALYEALILLVQKRAQDLVYPALTELNHCLNASIMGELIPMNLASLETIVGCFDADFFRGKILALEDVNEPPYKVFRAMHHLRNAGVLAGLKALVIGYFGNDRQQIIEETMLPIAHASGLPLFDWPIFGHEKPNWPLLFGARVTISRIDSPFYTLVYNEQHDKEPINHDTL